MQGIAQCRDSSDEDTEFCRQLLFEKRARKGQRQRTGVVRQKPPAKEASLGEVQKQDAQYYDETGNAEAESPAANMAARPMATVVKEAKPDSKSSARQKGGLFQPRTPPPSRLAASSY